MPFEKQWFTNKFEFSNVYWKDGIKHDVHRWLRDNIGPRCTAPLLWDADDDGSQWIFQGSQIRKKHQLHTITMRFRNKSQALLFKLTWGGRL